MTNSKIDRIEKEMQKTREKISEYQNRLKELAAQKTEAENLQIIALVRSMRLTPAELTALLSGEPIPGIAAAGTDYMEQEEIENEELKAFSKQPPPCLPPLSSWAAFLLPPMRAAVRTFPPMTAA